MPWVTPQRALLARARHCSVCDGLFFDALAVMGVFEILCVYHRVPLVHVLCPPCLAQVSARHRRSLGTFRYA